MEIAQTKLKKNQLFSFYKILEKRYGDDLKLYVSEMVFEKKSYIYQPPIIDKYLYEVVRGAVKLGAYTENGEEYIYDVLSAGEFFGNLDYLGGQFIEFSKAMIDVEIRIYDLEFFKREIKNDPDVAEWFFGYLTKRWCMAETKLFKVNEKSIAAKLSFLKKLYSQDAIDNHGVSFNVYELLTQKDKGDLVGATRQTIASTLKK
jgi:CRP-like cAMP-binding protein